MYLLFTSGSFFSLLMLESAFLVPIRWYCEIVWCICNKAYWSTSSITTIAILDRILATFALYNFPTHFLHLTEDREEFINQEQKKETHETDENLEDIRIEELKKAPKRMKRGKAAGPGRIPIGLIKAAPHIFLELLTIIFNKYLYREQPPKEWKSAYISSIFKNGSRTEFPSYRSKEA